MNPLQRNYLPADYGSPRRCAQNRRLLATMGNGPMQNYLASKMRVELAFAEITGMTRAKKSSKRRRKATR